LNEGRLSRYERSIRRNPDAHMLTIRPFHANDLEDLYKISLATAFAGHDASHLYADHKLMGQIYSAPYAHLEPQLVLVVEDRDGVAGFAVGTTDTMAWEEKLERLWWPSLRQQYAMPPEADAPRWTADQRRIVMIHRPTRTPPAVALKFPAHLHLNLLPRLRGRGVGGQLFNEWLTTANEDEEKPAHVAVNRANLGAMRFWERMGFADLTLDGLPEGRTIWKGRP
jgi:GNAT superfamily N-acetyltransferase